MACPRQAQQQASQYQSASILGKKLMNKCKELQALQSTFPGPFMNWLVDETDFKDKKIDAVKKVIVRTQSARKRVP